MRPLRQRLVAVTGQELAQLPNRILVGFDLR